MAIHMWRGSVTLFTVMVLIAALGYAANADSPWQLLLVLAMGIMSAVIMTLFGKRPLPIAIPVRVAVPVRHE
jgi:hypothetical protein